MSDYLVHQLKGFYVVCIFAHQRVKAPTSWPTRRTDSWTVSLKTVGHFQSVRFGLHGKVFRIAMNLSADYINRAIGTMATRARLPGAAKGEVTSVKADHRAQ